MQIGSLVECIKPSNGMCPVNGINTPLLPPVNVGELRIVRKIDISTLGNPILMFEEHLPVFHPTLGVECGYRRDHYKEVMPPQTITIESLISEPQTV